MRLFRNSIRGLIYLMCQRFSSLSGRKAQNLTYFFAITKDKTFNSPYLAVCVSKMCNM